MKNLAVFLGGIAIVILVVALARVGVKNQPNEPVAENPTPQTESPQQPQQPAETPQTPENQPPTLLPGQTFTSVLPNDWPGKDRAEKDINKVLLPAGQKIEFGIVTDPVDPTYAYFATSSPLVRESDAGKMTILNSIYKYNLQDYTFERIYKKEYSSSPLPFFHVLGVDNGKLVVLYQSIDDSPGPCTEPLTLGREEQVGYRQMMSLDLQNPFAEGLERYTIPDDVYNQALTKQNGCVKNLQ